MGQQQRPPSNVITGYAQKYQINISLMDVFEDEPFERLIRFLFMLIPMKGVAGNQSKSLRNVGRVEKIENTEWLNKLKISTIIIAFMEWFEGKMISVFKQIYHVEC